MAEQQTEARQGREGGRWINERPTSLEFGEWFAENMKIDPALDAENYVGGVVLIPATDRKSPVVTGFREGKPLIEEREELSFIPYAKVETRINYYWDLLAAHPEWVGTVAPDALDRLPIEREATIETVTEDGKTTIVEKLDKPSALATMVHQLPAGFSIVTVPVADRYTHFLCCTIRVAIWDREEWKALGMQERIELSGTGLGALRTGRGTKQVPMLTGRTSPWADPNSLMKAETGALGRALGFAGIFVIPGSGVATAEDMQESAAQGVTSAQEPESEGNAGPAAPEVAAVRTGAETAVDEEAALRAKAAALYKALAEDHPGRAEEFGKWAQERKLTSLGQATGATLRGVVRKLEKLTDEAEQSAQQLPIEETIDVPAEAVQPEQPSDDPAGTVAEAAVAEGSDPDAERSAEAG